MNGTGISPVRDRRALSEFLSFPYDLYRGHPYWVPPLRVAQKELFDRAKHPFYKHAEVEFFLARQGGRVVGRIAGILDRNHNQFHGENAGFFGFLEAVEDQGVFDGLLGTARQWLRERGAEVVRGPMNPSTNYECGMLVDGFDSSPVVMMTYNPPYYPRLVERAGLRKVKDLYAYFLTSEVVSREKAERTANRHLASGRVRIRPIRMNEFSSEVDRVWSVYNSAWSQNWGFVPMTREEFAFLARDMKTILKPELVLLGEVNQQVVGFALALPDVNQALKRAGGRLFPFGLLKILYHQRKIRTARVVVLGVLEQYRTRAIAAAFYAELVRNGLKLGYDSAEMSWVLEDNVLMNRSIEALGAKPYKTYRIYEWS